MSRTLTLKKEYITPDGRKIKGFFKIKGTDKVIPIVENKDDNLIVLSSKGINKEAWKYSLHKIRQLQEELPQVNDLLKKVNFNGNGLIVQADPFLSNTEHTEIVGDADFNPLTNTISFNTVVGLSDDYTYKDIEKISEKRGTFKKFGRTLSSTNPLHTAVHEYAHAIQLALCAKFEKDKDSAIRSYATRRIAEKFLMDACKKTNTSYTDFVHSLSAVASKHYGEAFSEAIANAILSPEENNKTSQALWQMVKAELG